MNDWRDLARLPRSEEEWRRMTTRLQQAARIAADMPPEPGWSLAPFAWTALAATAAAVIAVAHRPAPLPAQGAMSALLAPADSTGAAWATDAAPPDAAELIVGRMRADH